MKNLLFVFVLAIAAPALAAQAAPAANGSITVVKPDGSSIVMTDAMLNALPRVTVTAPSHDKRSFEGTELRAVLTLAGVKETEGLKGQLLARVVTVVASDGYRMVLPLSDLDPSIGNLKVFLVNRVDGAPIPEEDGRWRLVIPSDERPARWVKLIVRLEVSDLK
jgi:hypothetical protein